MTVLAEGEFIPDVIVVAQHSPASFHTEPSIVYDD